MSFKRRFFSMRILSVLLIVMMLWSMALPIATVFAEGEDVPPSGDASVPSQPAPEQNVQQEQTVQDQTTQSQNTDNAGADAADGQTGNPAPENNTPKENGTDGNTPAENGGNGQNGSNAAISGSTDSVPTVVNTGDAKSGTTDLNDVNNGAVTVGQNTASSTENESSASSTPSGPGGSTDVSVGFENDLAMANNATSSADTGSMTVKDADGVSATTGKADAYLYLLSFFNIAITNSSGSILFLRNPLGSALDFTDRIMNLFKNMAAQESSCTLLACSLVDAIVNIFTDSSAEITQSAVARANTGDVHGTSSDGSVDIATGNANAFLGVVNFGNLEIIDSRYLIILMNNIGDLAGDIILPEGSFFQSLSSGAHIGRDSTLNVANTADVTIDAGGNGDTGQNGAAGENTANIVTGNADVDVSAITYANQIGAPICFIVSVGGSWNGEVIQMPDGFTREHAPFGDVICGSGGAHRAAVEGLHASTTNYAKLFIKAFGEATTGGNSGLGKDVNIKTGDAKVFVQVLNVLNQTIVGQDWIFALFTVTGDWNGDLVFGKVPGDTDPAHDVASQLLAGAQASGGGAPGGYTSNPNIKITKTSSVTSADAPVSVDYTITLKNEGEGIAYRSKLTDTLKDPKGDVVYTRTWNLDSIAQGEEVTVTYTVEYNEDIPYGIYTNTAEVTGFRNSSIYVYPNKMTPASASASVAIGPKTQALAVQPAERCMPLIKSYMRLGAENNVEDVKNLQNFLNESEGESLVVTGEYNAATAAAVKRFQAKYTSEVLTPWGIDAPTGHVYYTTQRKINDLACINGDTFPLTQDQINEIDKFRSRYEASPETIDPASEGVGKRPVYEPYTLSPVTPNAVKVLLNDLAPKKARIDTAANVPHDVQQRLGAFSWMLKLVPFVDAFEL